MIYEIAKFGVHGTPVMIEYCRALSDLAHPYSFNVPDYVGY
jgi:hypothetical protein